MDTVVAFPIAPSRALVHEQGWQSWSPSTTYPVGTLAHRPASEQNRVMSYRPDVRQPDLTYPGGGVLAVDGRSRVPSIRAEVDGTGDLPARLVGHDCSVIAVPLFGRGAVLPVIERSQAGAPVSARAVPVWRRPIDLVTSSGEMHTAGQTVEVSAPPTGESTTDERWEKHGRRTPPRRTRGRCPMPRLP